MNPIPMDMRNGAALLVFVLSLVGLPQRVMPTPALQPGERVLLPAQLQEKLKRFYGPLYEGIKKANRVSLIRIDADNWRVSGVQRIGGYRVLQDGPDLSPQAVDKLRALILDPKNLPMLGRTGWGKGCGFEPGVAIRFEWPLANGHSRSGHLLFCLSCGDIGVIRKVGAKRMRQKWKWTPPNVEIEDMSPIESTLLHFFAELMPDDPAFKSLIELEPLCANNA